MTFRPFKLAVAYMTFVLAAGTAGYAVVEKWPLAESLYMTVITVSTVGFGEVHPLSAGGRILTVALILGGWVGVAYGAGVLGSALIEGQIQKALGRKKLQTLISKIKDHYIICGGGRVGRMVAEALEREDMPFLVVDANPEVIEHCEARRWLCVSGNGTEDETLAEAGIRRAKGVVACLSSDADNVFVTITARQLNPGIRIYARASDESAERKLKSAGAHHVALAYKIGGLRLAQAILRPNAVDFLEMTIHKSDINLQIEELPLTAEAPYAGKELKETDLRSAYNVIVVAVKKPGGEFVFNPESNHRLEQGDLMIVLGRKESLDRLERRLGIDH